MRLELFFIHYHPLRLNYHPCRLSYNPPEISYNSQETIYNPQGLGSNPQETKIDGRIYGHFYQGDHRGQVNSASKTVPRPVQRVSKRRGSSFDCYILLIKLKN